MSQNIDNLEEKTGLDMENKVVQAHGANFGATCAACGKKCDRKKLEAGIASCTVYRCEEEGCGGPVKPDIVFFGEGLPDKFHRAWEKIKNDGGSEDGGCDLMIVVGTALAVPPFCNTIA